MVKRQALVALCIIVILVSVRLVKAGCINLKNLVVFRYAMDRQLAGLYWASGLRAVRGLTLQTRIVFDERFDRKVICRDLGDIANSDY